MDTFPRWLLILVGICLVVYLAWYFQLIIIYMLVAGILSLILLPLKNIYKKIKIYKWSLPNWFNALLTLFSFYIILGGIISIFIPLVIEEAKLISQINPKEIYYTLEEPLNKLQHLLEQYKLTDKPGQTPEQIIQKGLSNLLGAMDIGKIFNSILDLMGNAFVAFFSISFITFFFLKDEGLFRTIIMTLTPTRYEKQAENILKSSRYLLSRYFIGITIQITLITLIVSTGLHFVGIKNAILIGFFAGIINVIPYIGPMIGAAFGLLIGLTTNLHLPLYPDLTWLLVKIMAVFAFVQTLDNILFQPLIFSNSVKAHPLEIFIILLMAANVGGIPGMIIAIPTYTLIRIIAREFFSQTKIVQRITKNMDTQD